MHNFKIKLLRLREMGKSQRPLLNTRGISRKMPIKVAVYLSASSENFISMAKEFSRVMCSLPFGSNRRPSRVIFPLSGALPVLMKQAGGWSKATQRRQRCIKRLPSRVILPLSVSLAVLKSAINTEPFYFIYSRLRLRYVGMLENGMRHGHGTWTSADGSTSDLTQSLFKVTPLTIAPQVSRHVVERQDARSGHDGIGRDEQHVRKIKSHVSYPTHD